jgi:hypothetical protein
VSARESWSFQKLGWAAIFEGEYGAGFSIKVIHRTRSWDVQITSRIVPRWPVDSFDTGVWIDGSPVVFNEEGDYHNPTISFALGGVTCSVTYPRLYTITSAGQLRCGINGNRIVIADA